MYQYTFADVYVSSRYTYEYLSTCCTFLVHWVGHNREDRWHHIHFSFITDNDDCDNDDNTNNHDDGDDYEDDDDTLLSYLQNPQPLKAWWWWFMRV